MLKWFWCIRVCVTFIIWGKWPMFSVVLGCFVFFWCVSLLFLKWETQESLLPLHNRRHNNYVCRMHITCHKKAPRNKNNRSYGQKSSSPGVGTPQYKVTVPNSWPGRCATMFFVVIADPCRHFCKNKTNKQTKPVSFWWHHCRVNMALIANTLFSSMTHSRKVPDSNTPGVRRFSLWSLHVRELYRLSMASQGIACKRMLKNKAGEEEWADK